MLPVVHWYCLMGLGVVLEDTVQGGVGYFEHLHSGKWRYAIGYVWVWLFFSWSLPKLFFPMVDCGS